MRRVLSSTSDARNYWGDFNVACGIVAAVVTASFTPGIAAAQENRT
jgi:hypothetical protein